MRLSQQNIKINILDRHIESVGLNVNIYTRSTSICRFQPVEKGLDTSHGLKRIVVLLSKSITQEMTLYRLARRELS
jgi:hypothetical protein